MGLDMYLYRKTSLYSWGDAKVEVKVTYDGEEIPLTEPREISEEVGYWRKANHIHKWFVDNVQSGTDDCGSYDVSEEQLMDLLELCREVKKKAILAEGEVNVGTSYSNGETKQLTEKGHLIVNAEEISKLLPTESGFFFGGTDYDKYYLQSVDNTIEIIEKVLSQPKLKGLWTYHEYRSSW